MCDKLPYCNPRIDICLRELINLINKNKLARFKTLASCCGHKKYHKSIVVKDIDGNIFEMFSGTNLTPKKRNRYYKKDQEGYYYIPEISFNKLKISNLTKKEM